MQFVTDADIVTSTNQTIGRLKRVVLDPKSKQVTHLVVRKGNFFTEDKVLPIDWVESAAQERIVVRGDKEKFAELDGFEETHFVMVNEEEIARGNFTQPVPGFPAALYPYPPYGDPLRPPLTTEPAYRAETETNVPAGTVAVKEGATVITCDDQPIGVVDQVFVNSENRATHFLLSRGVLFKEKKLVPMDWIDRFDENQVQLSVGARTVEHLPNYQSA